MVRKSYTSRWISVGRARCARKGLRESTLPFVATVRTLPGALAAGARAAGISRMAASTHFGTRLISSRPNNRNVSRKQAL